MSLQGLNRALAVGLSCFDRVDGNCGVPLQSAATVVVVWPSEWLFTKR